VIHIATELEKLGEHFKKKFAINPMLIQKKIATAVSKVGSEADVRSTGNTWHSPEIHSIVQLKKKKIFPLLHIITCTSTPSSSDEELGTK